VIVRQDLPRGIQSAQCVHAAGHSAGAGQLPQGTYAVALATRDEGDLRALAERLKRAGLAHHLIHEPDPPFFGQLMAIGLEPNYKSKFRRYLSNLPLIK
jgi:peptidyl-tRNA hydrolase